MSRLQYAQFLNFFRCENPYKQCFRLLDLTGPLQIGGLPSLPTTFQITNKDFTGCIRNFYIDHVLLNLNSSITYVGQGSEEGCPAKKPRCDNKPCLYGGEHYLPLISV